MTDLQKETDNWKIKIDFDRKGFSLISEINGKTRLKKSVKI